MKEPQIGHIGIYRGCRYTTWWKYGVRWSLASDLRSANLEPTGEVGKVERFRYIAWMPYRGRKAEWKTYYRGGIPA